MMWGRIDRRIALLLATLVIGVFETGFAAAGELRDPFADGAQLRFERLRQSIELRAMQYDLDWTWIAAVAFQESGFDPAARGPGGHIGVMQIAPATAASLPVSIERIDRPDDNIHAGVRYLRYIIDRHFAEPGISDEDRMLMAIAGYQAGPLYIDQARGWARTHNLDADRWFGGVEVAVRKLFGNHTVSYVEDVAAYREAFQQASLVR
jgi:membrane-bound lytic murein transglycosylase MltF